MCSYQFSYYFLHESTKRKIHIKPLRKKDRKRERGREEENEGGVKEGRMEGKREGRKMKNFIFRCN